MAALVEAGKIEMLIEFLRDPQVKPLQFEMLRVEVGADIQRHQDSFGGKANLTVGSAALIACLGNSSSNGLDGIKETKLEKAQKQAGELYLSGGSEKDGYKIVAKVIWDEGFDRMLKGQRVTQNYSPKEWEKKIKKLQEPDVDTSGQETKVDTSGQETKDEGAILSEDAGKEAISKKGPQHRLRRLLHLLNTFGEHWAAPYTRTSAKL